MELLKGIRVLDLTRLYPGPYCTLLLAQMGAEVIKVESPGEGDYMRYMGPEGSAGSLYFESLNANKKSIALNLKKERERDVLLRLAATADILVEGFRPGVMDALGLGYEDIKKVKPDIIYCSITGYGQDGPYRDRAGHDLNYIALAGILALTGTQSGAPVIPGVQIGDVGGGALMACTGILAALFNRQAGRGGCYLDVAMLDGLISWLSMPLADSFAGRPVGRGQMVLNGGLACYNVYRTADGGFMALGAMEPKFWQNFCKAAGREDLLPRQYEDDQERLIGELQELFAGKTRKEWETLLAGADACCEPVLSIGEMKSHPQVEARGLVVDGKFPAFPFKVTPGIKAKESPAPALGQDTEAVLRELGLTKEEVDEILQQ